MEPVIHCILEDYIVEREFMENNELLVGDKFLLLFFFQVKPKDALSVRKILSRFLEITPDIDQKKSNIYDIYGKHDLLCILFSNNLIKTIDRFYTWIKIVDGIVDYAKIIGFI